MAITQKDWKKCLTKCEKKEMKLLKKEGILRKVVEKAKERGKV